MYLLKLTKNTDLHFMQRGTLPLNLISFAPQKGQYIRQGLFILFSQLTHKPRSEDNRS